MVTGVEFSAFKISSVVRMQMVINYLIFTWKVIFDLLRTFNDIKNHFYSMLRKGLRRINKFLKKHKIQYKYASIR